MPLTKILKLTDKKIKNTVYDSAKFSVFTDGIISYLYTKDTFVSSLYSHYSFLSYSARSLLRACDNSASYKIIIGALCSSLKYHPIKHHLEFTNLDCQLNNSAYKAMSLLVGGINNAAYEYSILFQENSGLSIEQQVFWYNIPYTIEASDDIIKYYITNTKLEKLSQCTMSNIDSWQDSNADSFSTASHLYSGLANVHYSQYDDIKTCLNNNALKYVFFNTPFLSRVENNVDYNSFSVTQTIYLGYCFSESYYVNEELFPTTVQVNNEEFGNIIV